MSIVVLCKIGAPRQIPRTAHCSRQQIEFRQAFYTNILSLTQAQLTENIQDIALTVGLHPASLGVESECDGRVYIPKNLEISVLVAENLYEVAQARQAKLASTGDNDDAKTAAFRACAEMTLTSEQTIPSKIMQIKIAKGSVAVVIVVEHRNIETHLNAIREHLPNSLVVMVKFPSISDVPRAGGLHSRLKGTRPMQQENS